MESVTLLRNPKRGHRRTRRNPDMVKSITRPLPDMMDVVAGLAGAAVALQAPNILKATKWMNVLWSGVFTIGGSVALKMAKVDKSKVDAFALGGTVITAAKAAHVATNGKIGLSPSLTFAPQLPGGSPPPAPAATAGFLPPAAGIEDSGGLGRYRVGAFRESQLEGQPGEFEQPLLT